MKQIVFGGTLVFLTWIACSCGDNKQSSGSETQSVANVDSLRGQLRILTDSLDRSWQDMLAADNEKVSKIDQLLTVFPQRKQYNVQQYDAVNVQRKALSQLRFGKPEQLTSPGIDRYDAATDSLMRNIMALGATSPSFDSDPLSQSLLVRIGEINQAMVFYRIRYDSHAQAYNTFIAKHKAALSATDPSFGNLAPRPLFQLPL